MLHLDWEKRPVVTIEQVMAILDCTYDHAGRRGAQLLYHIPIEK